MNKCWFCGENSGFTCVCDKCKEAVRWARKRKEEEDKMERMKDLVSMIARRDSITKNEAQNIVDETAREIDDAIAHGASYDTVADILADYLGLEPDYLDLFF